MTARPPFSTVLQTKDFAVVLRLTVTGRNPTSIAGGNCISAGLADHRASPELAPHGRPQQPQPGQPPHELQRILEQLALEENLFDQSGRFAVGSRMADAIDGACEGQWFESLAARRQIFADENMTPEHPANLSGVSRRATCGQSVQTRPDDVRGAAESRKIGMFVEQAAAIAPEIAALYVPAVFSRV